MKLIAQVLTIALTASVAAGCSKTTNDDTASTNEAAKTAAEAPAAAAIAPAPTPMEAVPVAAGEQEACGAPAEAQTECGASGGECGMPGSSCNQWDEQALAVTKRDVPENAVWKAWEVEGMHCGGCERRVIAKVGEIDGVVAVEADAGLGRVRVAVLKGHESSVDAVPGRIGELGYRVK